MTEDDELSAMQSLLKALDPLDDTARKRVLAWASARYEISLPRNGGEQAGRASDEREEGSYTDVGDLVEAFSPVDGPQYALAVAYWLQVVHDRPGWTAAEVNDTLKNLGRGASNITKTLSSLMKRKPALVMQTAKTGRAQQARKTYKLTSAGVRAVESKLRNDDEANQ